MSLRLGSMAVGAAAVVASFSFASNDANACGGCFHGPPPIDQPDQTTVVTGHRMALSASPDRTVLWDQIEYSGKPEEFAWVLPVRPGAFLELASDAFFEALDAATATTIRSKTLQCPDTSGGNGGFYEGGDYSGSGCNAFACGAMAAEGAGNYDGFGGGDTATGGGGGAPNPPDPVAVVHKASIGPYETVTIHSNVPGALYTWLEAHGFVVDDSLKPMIDDYETEGFDFIALRLIPGEDVQQMQPVRVVSPGASPVLPLRMVSAGTGPNVAITLFVIGEGRWVTQNFPGDTISGDDLTWDYATQSSNFSTVRMDKLAQQDGRVWLTSFSRLGPLLEQLDGPDGLIDYRTSSGDYAESMFELYMKQGVEEGANADPGCVTSLGPQFNGNPKVVAPCGLTNDDGTGGTGGSGGTGGTGGSTGGTGGSTGGTGGSTGGAGGATGGTGGTGGTMCSDTIGPDEIDARTFSCGPLDDMAAALVGLHPHDVWVTRLEANLPHAALSEDLGLQADPSQQEVSNSPLAMGIANPPCTGYQAYGDPGAAPLALPGAGANRKPPRNGPPPGGHGRDLVLFGIALALFAGTVARRIARPQLRSSRNHSA